MFFYSFIYLGSFLQKCLDNECSPLDQLKSKPYPKLICASAASPLYLTYQLYGTVVGSLVDFFKMIYIFLILKENSTYLPQAFLKVTPRFELSASRLQLHNAWHKCLAPEAVRSTFVIVLRTAFH